MKKAFLGFVVKIKKTPVDLHGRYGMYVKDDFSPRILHMFRLNKKIKKNDEVS